VLPQDPDVIAGSVLHAAIGVMDQTWRRLSLRQSLLQRGDRQSRRQRSLQSPAHHLTRIAVQNHGQVDKLGF
jgi:hypothetical protein